MKIVLHFFRHMCFCLLVLGITGCVVLPVPRTDTAMSRCNISEQEISPFKPGSTSRREIILALGEPDAVTIDERKLVYCSQQFVAWVLLVGYGGGADFAITDTDFFVAEIDANGILTRFAESKHLPELFPTLSSYGGHTVLLQKKAKLYPDVDGFKGWWYKGSVGISGQLLLTDKEVLFLEYTVLANAAPVRRLPYSLINTERLDKFGRIQRLVVCDRTGKLFSYEILGPKGMMVDLEAMQQAHDLIQRRISR